MGGRGSSSGGSGGSGGRGSLARQAVSQDGSIINLFDTPLQYGKLDSSLGKKARAAIEAQETKRLKAKIEYAYAVDADGNPVGREIRGGKSSANIPYWLDADGGTFTHNHPRSGNEAGVLGGTFSAADINIFSKRGFKTMRASASEGTYSISKGKNFDAKGLMSFQKSVEMRVNEKIRAKTDAAYERYRRGEITREGLSHALKKISNTALVEMHNELLANQKKYGYVYALERKG